MAKFDFNGIDTLIADFEKLAVIDEETTYSILGAGAEAMRTVWQAVIRRMGLMDPKNPQLINSLELQKKRSPVEGYYIRVMPYGPRKDRNRSHRRRKAGGFYTNTNDEVGFLLEYGTPRIKARHWMETANDIAYEDTVEAMQEAWNEHLDDLNL